MRSTAWIWDFSSTHSTTARSGGCRYSPTTSRILATSAGSEENLKVSVRHGLTPCSRHTRAIVSRLTPSSRASRQVDQCVIPSPGGGGLEVTWRISARRLRRTVWVGLAGTGQADPPARGAHTGDGTPALSVARPRPGRRSGCWRPPPAASSRIRARWVSTAGSRVDRARRPSTPWSSGAMGSGAAAGMRHARISHHTVKRVQRRSTRLVPLTNLGRGQRLPDTALVRISLRQMSDVAG